MILQALNQYYQRKTSCDESALPPFGFEKKSIPVIFELDMQADIVQIRVTDTKKNPKAAEYIVPQGMKRAAGIAANLFWDNVEYALGITTREEPENEDKQYKEFVEHGKKVIERHHAFVERISQLSEPADSDTGVSVLRKFLQKCDPDSIQKLPDWEVNKEKIKSSNVSFRLQGDSCLICQRPAIQEVVKKAFFSDSEADNVGTVCLISGEHCVPERLHPSIKGVRGRGAQSSGGNIVSFNLDSFRSYGKEQGSNAPVSQKAAFAYTTALNHLLRKESDQRIQVGDNASTVVFWSEEPDPLEENFQTIWGATSKSIKDDPDKFTSAVKSVLSSVQRGSFSPSQKNDRFYVLGLSPNASRISIRFWVVGTVERICQRIRQYFDELYIVHSNSEDDFLPLFRLLKNIAPQEKIEKLPPNLAGEIMRSIMTGTTYPHTLLSTAIRRCKTEKSSVNYSRAAIIKAYLNRSQSKEEIGVGLDKDNTNTAYRLGRLFSVLEKIQEEANPGINATIRDRYYGAASANPVSVFPTLLKLKNHHLAKLDNIGRKTNFEKILSEVFSTMPADLPSNLSLQDQGRFAVGYYHQRQDFYTKHLPKQKENKYEPR